MSHGRSLCRCTVHAAKQPPCRPGAPRLPRSHPPPLPVYVPPACLSMARLFPPSSPTSMSLPSFSALFRLLCPHGPLTNLYEEHVCCTPSPAGNRQWEPCPSGHPAAHGSPAPSCQHGHSPSTPGADHGRRRCCRGGRSCCRCPTTPRAATAGRRSRSQPVRPNRSGRETQAGDLKASVGG